MGRQIHSWQIEGGERAWLSMLIDTMHDVARPERRAIPCDDRLLASLRAQLALPVQRNFTRSFSLRN
jgi:hypothetical protein